MAKAIAITLESPFGLAFLSLYNLFNGMAYFMYGTHERARFTIAFAFGLLMLAGLFTIADAGSMACSHDIMGL